MITTNISPGRFRALKLSALFLCAAGCLPALGYNFTFLNDPLAGTGSGQGTRAAGIYGSTIVGQYTDSNNETHGFIYNGTSYTTLDDPLADGVTTAWGVYGNNVVGYYRDSQGVDHGFLYNGSSYTTLDDPLGANGSLAFGIYSNTIVGNYINGGFLSQGFAYNGSSYATLNDPAGAITYAYGVYGSTIAGVYQTGAGYFGFTYNGSTYTTLPGSGYLPYGIGANFIVGSQPIGGFDHGFVFNGSTYSLVQPAGAIQSDLTGVYGNTVAGYYTDANGVNHGIITTVPEPGTLWLSGLGLFLGGTLAWTVSVTWHHQRQISSSTGPMLPSPPGARATAPPPAL